MRSTCSFLFSPSSGRMWEYYGFSFPRGWRERREPEVWQIPPNHLVGTGQAAENQDVCLSKQLSPREFFSLFFISCSLASLRFKLLLRVNPVAAVHSFNHVWLFVTPWTAARQAPVCLCLPEFEQTHIHWVSDAIKPTHSLSPLSPFALNLS